MRQFTFVAITLLFAVIPTIAQAGETKAPMTVMRFDDLAPVSGCPETPGTRINGTSQIREQMIAQLMNLNRFLIQEREVRPVKPVHSIMGKIRRFDVCQIGRNQEVNVEIEIKMISANGITRTFSSSSMASNTVLGKAPDQAIKAAVGEVIRRIDESVPRYRQVSLPIKRVRSVADNDVQIKLYRRSRR